MARRPLTPEEIAQIDELARAATHYAVLDVPVSAPRAQIDEAYRQFAREWHPDRFFSRDVGNLAQVIDDNFIRATKAYNTLRDDRQRSSYDDELRSTGAYPMDTPGSPPRSGVSLRSAARAAAGVSSTARSAAPAAPPPPEGHEVVLGKPGARSLGSKSATPASTASAGSTSTAAPAAEPRRPVVSPALARLGAQLAEQLGRAARYYESGKEDYDGGRFAKAESALYLATRYDPKNAEYQKLYADAQHRARVGRIDHYLVQADQAIEFGKAPDALIALRKAVEADGPSGAPAFRLFQLMVHENEGDRQQHMALLRKAVAKEPKNVTYRLALAELYLTMDMKVNAAREAQAALDAEPGSDAAKTMLKKARR